MKWQIPAQLANRRALLAVVALMAVLILGCELGMTRIDAKEAYSIASPYALAGESDAQLYEIMVGVRNPNEDGRASVWRLGFCSPSTGLVSELTVRDEDLFLGIMGDTPAGDAQPSEAWEEGLRSELEKCGPLAEWIDSTEAATTARANKIGELIDISLIFDAEDPPFVEGLDVWRFDYCVGSSGNIIFISATDGSFLGVGSGVCFKF